MIKQIFKLFYPLILRLYILTFILSFIIKSIHSLPPGRITVSHGKITKSGFNECVIESNGVINTFKDDDIPGLHFGLIKYNCDNEIGYLISKFVCKECGLFCNYNELIPGCSQYLTLAILGGIISLVLSIILILIFQKKIFYYISKMIYFLINKNQKNKDKRLAKEMNKIGENFGVYPNLKFVDKVNIKEKHKKASKYRKEHDYLELHEIQKPREESVPTAPKASSTSNLYPVFASALVGAAVINSVSSCDSTLFLNANGKICDLNKCEDLNMYRFPIRTGNNICFKDLEGEVLEIKLDKTYYRSRYNLMYYTSDIEIITDSYWACKGPMGECWYDKCHPTSVGERFTKNETKNIVQGYGCDSDTVGCDTYCYHQTSCTWFHWKIKEIGQPAPVFKYISEIWEVLIKITYKKIVTKYKLNVNNPNKDLENFNSFINNIPIYITSFSSESYNKEEFLIKVNNTLINTKASDLNMPTPGFIGDYQISLDHNTKTYPEDQVDCTATSCKPHCIIPQPRIRRLGSLAFKNSAVKEYTYYNKGEMIEIENNVLGLIDFMIGNVEFNNLQVIPASCKMDPIMTYSCSACNVNPYIIIQSYNIKQAGIIPFDSNCTFMSNYLSCTTEPFKLELKERQETCMIYIPIFNQTMVVSFKNEYLGKLEFAKAVDSLESNTEILKGILTSNGFWDGVTTILGSCALLSIISSIILRLIKIYQFNKIAKINNEKV